MMRCWQDLMSEVDPDLAVIEERLSWAESERCDLQAQLRAAAGVHSGAVQSSSSEQLVELQELLLLEKSRAAQLEVA